MSQLYISNSCAPITQGPFLMPQESKKNQDELTVDEMIGGRVRLLRKSMGLTQEDLGKLIGHTSVYISDLERGKRRWHVERIAKVAEVLNVNQALLQDPSVPIDQIEKIGVILGKLSDLPDEKLDTISQVLDGFRS